MQEERKALFPPFSLRHFRIWRTKDNCSNTYDQIYFLSITGWFSLVNAALYCNCSKIKPSNHNETGTDGSRRSILITSVQGAFNQYALFLEHKPLFVLVLLQQETVISLSN